MKPILLHVQVHVHVCKNVHVQLNKIKVKYLICEEVMLLVTFTFGSLTRTHYAVVKMCFAFTRQVSHFQFSGYIIVINNIVICKQH